MNKLFKTIFGSTLFLCLVISGLYAQDEKTKVRRKSFIGFEDKNQDGVNDRFQDAKGDGFNDVTSKTYPHKFQFRDKNKDGVNDLWVDVDGDGVNDLAHKINKKGEIENIVLDFDKDGKNDITGLKYDKKDINGHKFGFIDEKTGKIQGKFMDENGNGMDDRLEKSQLQQRYRKRDFFIDEDSDGICDGRGDRLRCQNRKGQRTKGGKHR